MSTERKDANHPLAETQQRNATGKAARDEQTGATIGGLRELKDNWTETKNTLRKDHNQLTEADLELKPGHEQETIDRIGRRLNKSAEEARRLVQDAARPHQKSKGNSSASTVGTHTQGMQHGHKDMPEAAERKARREAPNEEQRQTKPKA